MKFADAALAATYPLIVFLGLLAIFRYASVVTKLDNGIRHLVCSTIIIILGVVVEQVVYGAGRYTGAYITIATTPGLVGIGKALYTAGLVYMLYAFWLIHPNHVKWWNYPTVALFAWAVLALALMV